MAETHHVRQNIIMLVVGLVPICAVAKQSRPTTKNGCLRVLCRPFCLQPRYYGLPSLLKFDGPTSPGANYEKYDFSENRKVQNPPGWWVFLLTGLERHYENGTTIIRPTRLREFPSYLLARSTGKLARMSTKRIRAVLRIVT